MLCADGEPGAQVIAAARTTDQAKIVFGVAYQQVMANPALAEAFGLKAMKKGIEHAASASVMKPVSAQGKSLAGLLPYFCSLDETWAHRDRTVVDEMERGCAKRANSLLSTITHAGENLASVGHEQHDIACSILSGELADDQTFACIWSSEGYHWTSEEGWRAANPNWGVSVYADQIAAACERAQKVLTLQAVFRSHNCCEWIGSDITWIEPQVLVACREKNLRMEDFKFWHLGEHPNVSEPDVRRPFVLGMDLASRQDLASIAYLCIGYPNGGEQPEHYYCWTKNYLPESTVANSPIPKYRGWASNNRIIVHPGPSISLEHIQADILGQYRRFLGYGAVENDEGFSFEAAAFDEWQAAQISDNLAVAGIKTVPFPKQARYYSPVMDFFQSLVLQGRFHFASEDEILYWCLSNVVCHRDLNENLFPRKSEADRKIDAAIAMLYALKVALADYGKFVKPQSFTPPIVVLDTRTPFSGFKGAL